jgi:diguanylate cyclase (GGDEF)-like protein
MPRLQSKSGNLLRALLVLALTALFGVAQAQSTCFVSADASIRRLQIMVAKDATAALQVIQAELNFARGVPHPDPNRIATLVAVQAHAFSMLELDGAARTAAQEGIALLPDVLNPTHLELLSTYAENVYDQAGMEAAARNIETTAAQLAPDSVAESCLSITLGVLQHRQDRADLAIVNLMRAYQTGVTLDRPVQRKMAAHALTKVLRDMYDYEQALAMNAEAIEWDVAHDSTLSLSVGRYLRGTIHKEMREFQHAIKEFEAARALSLEVKDTQGIAFADMDLCQVQIEIGQLVEARRRCDSALRIFNASGSRDLRKLTRADLAYIDIQEGQAARALATLDDILNNDAEDVPARNVAPIFKLRSRANAALGKFRESHADLQEYLRRVTSADDARRIRQSATLRARFEMDRQLQRNAELNRELKASEQRQLDQKRWTAIAIGTGAIIIILLTIHVISIRRHRRQLATLANTDSLTALPNRRHTYRMGKEAMAIAAEAHAPLTVAVVDLDHFKSINDRFGHAGGDRVLQEFARVCRESIRAQDILGRWGGEEFLIVMPGASLEVALIALERLRTLALRIELPEMGAGLQVGLSAGLAALEPDVKTLDELIARADAALYRAKHEGRDLVRIADENFETASSGVRRALR